MENNMNAPLSVRGLCKNYPEFQLKSVSFSLEPGKITGFIGRNGAGKTTTINAVLALIRPDGGEVYFNGLTREEHARDLIPRLPAESPNCGLLEAGLLYFGEVFPKEEEPTLRKAFMDRFAAQYGSLKCAEMKPEEGCGGFAVDGILFALQFYLDQLKDRVKDD